MASQMTIHQRSSETLRDFLTRFRAKFADIPNLVEELAINYLASDIDKHRHATLLEEFFEKNPRHSNQPFKLLNIGCRFKKRSGASNRLAGSTKGETRVEAPVISHPRQKTSGITTHIQEEVTGAILKMNGMTGQKEHKGHESLGRNKTKTSPNSTRTSS